MRGSNSNHVVVLIDGMLALMDRYGAPSLMAGKQAAARNEKVETREEGLGYRIGLRQQKWLQRHARR